MIKYHFRVDKTGDYVTINNEKHPVSSPVQICTRGINEEIEIVFEFVKEHFDIDSLQYAFMGREFILSREQTHIKSYYSAYYPFSFITLIDQLFGLTFILDTPLLYSIDLLKNKDACYVSFTYHPNYKSDIRILLKKHSTSWKDGIKEYQTWFNNKYGKIMPNDNIKHIFHVKRCFFYKELCPASIIDNNEIRLIDSYNNDCDSIGGIDLMLLFDYSYNPQNNIRCGNNSPCQLSQNLLDQLNYQIKQLKNNHHILFFLYIDPYYVEEGSDWNIYKENIAIRGLKNEICRNWTNKQWHPCVNQPLWKKLINDFLTATRSIINIDGIYIDEFGFGIQYTCHNSNHNHGNSYNQNQSELEFLDEIQFNQRDCYWMSEYATIDAMSGRFSIVLSDSKSLINLYRFIFPNIKYIRVINCDMPIGDNLDDINKSFFNGEGLWLDNDLNDIYWYSLRLKQQIRLQYTILQEYADLFYSENVEPLYQLHESNGIYCNRFSNLNLTILTFINMKDMSEKASLFLNKLSYRKNLYNTGDVSISANLLSITIPPHEVSCLLFENQ